VEAREKAGRLFYAGVVAAIIEAKEQGAVPSDIDPVEAAAFLNSSIAGIRIAARGGADDQQLRGLGRLALRALS
jgi:hypothetical protein